MSPRHSGGNPVRLAFVVIATAAAATIAACGSITAVQLDPSDLTKKKDASEGIVYFLPKPYLLVAAGPKREAGTATHKLSGDQRSKLNEILAKTRGLPTANAGDISRLIQSVLEEPPKPEGGTTADQTPAPVGDSTSFWVGADQYLVKLVYLPDCAHPMALKISAGLFGNISVHPQLQNGWMLTSLNGTVDNSALLSSLSTIVTAVKGQPPAAVSAPDTGTKGDQSLSTAARAANGAAAPGLGGEPFPTGLHEITCTPTKEKSTSEIAVRRPRAN